MLSNAKDSEVWMLPIWTQKQKNSSKVFDSVCILVRCTGDSSSAHYLQRSTHTHTHNSKTTFVYNSATLWSDGDTPHFSHTSNFPMWRSKNEFIICLLCWNPWHRHKRPYLNKTNWTELKPAHMTLLWSNLPWNGWTCNTCRPIYDHTELQRRTFYCICKINK